MEQYTDSTLMVMSKKHLISMVRKAEATEKECLAKVAELEDQVKNGRTKIIDDVISLAREEIDFANDREKARFIKLLEEMKK